MIIRNLASKTKNPSMLRLRSAQASARGDPSGRAESRPFSSQNQAFNLKKLLLARKRIFSKLY
jgi:hypothetical protein